MKKIVFLSVLFSCCMFISCNSQPGHGTIAQSAISFLNDKESSIIPFERIRGLIVIRLSINGSKEMSFILDSGAPLNILTNKELSANVNLNITGNVSVKGSDANKPVNVPLATGVKFTIGEVEINNASLAVGMQTDILPGVDGIIGKCFFENAVIGINWKMSTITVTKKSKFNYKGQGNILPITILTSGHIAVDVSLKSGENQIATKAIIDIGNKSGTFIDKAKGIILIENNNTLKDIIVGWGINGSIVGDVVRATVTLGYNEFKNIPVTFRKVGETLTRQGADGNIGLAILERFDLIFDYPGNRIILEKNDRYDTEFLYNQTGILLNPKRDGDYLLVAGIIPASPAEEAGIIIGDKIISANGISAEIKNLSFLNEIITGMGTQDIELNIQRDGTFFKKNIKPRKII